MKFKTKSKEKIFELLKETVEQRKVYLRGPNSKTLTLPSKYCKILDIKLNKNVLINLFITLNFRHDSTEKTILSYDNFNVFEYNFCSRWQIIYPSY